MNTANYFSGNQNQRPWHLIVNPAARGSKQKFDNDYDVIFMCYKCNMTQIAME